MFEIIPFDPGSDLIAGNYDELPLWSSYFGRHILDRAEYRKGMNVLDIGCGTGYPLIELAMRLGQSSHLTGVDMWKAAIDRIRKKIEFGAITNVTLLQNDYLLEDFPENSFDLIVSNNGINNIPDQEQVIRKISRELKHGGSFIFTFNLPETMYEFYTLLREVMESAGENEGLRLLDEHIHFKRKNTEFYLTILKNTEFELISADYDKFSYHFADAESLFSHSFIRLAFLPSWIGLLPGNGMRKYLEQVTALMNEGGIVTLTVPFVCIKCKKKEN
ncbi:MAG: class I SAM-dependent methyltransferase [Ignavibacteriales bacterium]|nr:class I SAM-dependent methyltransferase [Ignavibacteriales bacterium]MCF8306089.1 class I SAM-dependent methyltransferase [Ignavibacteriales bacterium]MCF8315856.1 class I SAM-dependent methyltransferase [Ignavibacteriales bacterium]MCF8437316.1 class I SAM-dependent methyltransferase [Ignavibacteriales bacterium]